MTLGPILSRTAVLLTTVLAGCIGRVDLDDQGTACVVTEGADIGSYYYPDTASPEPALPEGPSTVVAVLDDCYSSSVRDEHASCVSSTAGATIAVTSEGGYKSPVGSVKDDCNMLIATCPGPDLTTGTWTLDYGGQTLEFDVPSDDAPCIDL